jgi:regulator of sigma E protease
MDSATLTNLITFIIGIILLIIVHELGHFLAARMLKVEVNEFGIGFPPRIAGTAVDVHGKRRWFGPRPPEDLDPKKTIFSLNWIPLGGFVRPKGENDPSIQGGLAAASPWVRLGVLIAGPGMNILVGVIIGIALVYNFGERITEKVQIASIASGSPAEAAGIQTGDLVVEVNGQSIDNIGRLQGIIASNLGNTVSVVLSRGDKTFIVRLTPRTNPPAGQGPLGVGLDNPTRPIGIGTAVTRGSSVAFENIRAIIALPGRLISGQATPEESRLVGYKGMFDIYQRIQSPWYFFMMISMSLGFMNLLPIPALDGGRILFTLPEILIRRRVPTKFENAVNLVSLGLLLLLLFYINAQDFINPIQLP